MFHFLWCGRDGEREGDKLKKFPLEFQWQLPKDCSSISQIIFILGIMEAKDLYNILGS